MSEGLQIHAGQAGATSPLVRTTELILDKAYTEKAIEFIKDAKSEIMLCAYAWRWYSNEPEIGIQKFNIELKKAQMRGVTVRCILNNETMASYFATLGFKTLAVQPTRMMHTKALLIDSKTLILGSHNFTKRANTDNYEASIATQEPEACLQFQQYFDRLWVACAHC